jgi:hypothetical protein
MMQDVHGKLNPRLAWKINMQQVEESFHQQTGLKFKEELSKELHLSYNFIRY